MFNFDLFVGWGQWESYSVCSATCGQGTKTRKRFCDGGHSGFGGCQGDNQESINCYSGPCPGKFYGNQHDCSSFTFV